MRRSLAGLIAVLSSLALAVGLLAMTSASAEAQRAPSLTKKALRNAPIHNVCGGWKGRFRGGVLKDRMDYESIRVLRVALGNLDGRRGRDGAIVVRCDTRMPYPDFVVAYTADRKGKPVQRHVRSISSLDRTLDRYDGEATRFALTRKRIVVGWEAHETDSSGENWESGVVPTVATLGLRKGRLVRLSMQRQGLRWLSRRFATAMRHKNYALASRITSPRLVREVKGFPARGWTKSFTWYYGDWQPGDNRYEGLVLFSGSTLSLELKFSESRRRWVILAGHWGD